MEYIQEEDKEYGADNKIALRKQKLYNLLLISGGLDIIISVVGTPAWLASLGSGFIIEEALEGFISKFISKQVSDFELDTMDYTIGALPIPGITAVSVRCLRELMKLKK